MVLDADAGDGVLSPSELDNLNASVAKNAVVELQSSESLGREGEEVLSGSGGLSNDGLAVEVLRVER